MTIYIPTPLRTYVAGKHAVEVDAPTVAEALEGLIDAHPNLRMHLFTAEGKNDEDIRYLPAKEATAVTEGDTLSIIPSIAGGCWDCLDRRGDLPPRRTRLQRRNLLYHQR
jgi:adenylyltransferase/sulfurtransferase